MSGDELAARLAVGLQTPGKMQYKVLENDQGQLVFPAPPTPIVQLASVDGAGRLRQGTADGSIPVIDAFVEARGATNSAILFDIEESLHANPLAWLASGDIYTAGPWVPIIPNAIAADGAGLPAAAAFVAGSAGDRIDVMLWMTVDTIFGANQYQFDFRTDPLGAATGPNATNPAWVAVEIPLLAGQTTPGNTWGHRFFTTVDGEAFGIADGANGDWPNNAQVSFYGFYRYV